MISIELTSDERWLIQEAIEAEIDALNGLRRLDAASEYDDEKLATVRRLLEKIKTAAQRR
jgi:hypothetical protein